MRFSGLSEYLSLLPGQRQRDLILVTAFFLQEVERLPNFSTSLVRNKLRARVTGASKINVGAVLINQCMGLVEPDDTKMETGEKAWRLTSRGEQYVVELLGLPGRNGKGRLPAAPSYSLSDLHPIIKKSSEKLFRNGHLSEAVEMAVKAVNKYVRKKTGRTSDGGVPMMQKIFSPNEFKGKGDCLSLNALSTQSDKDEQDGYRFLFAGIQAGIRNPFDHDGRAVDSKIIAMEYLALASHLVRMVDKAQPA